MAINPDVELQRLGDLGKLLSSNGGASTMPRESGKKAVEVARNLQCLRGSTHILGLPDDRVPTKFR